MPELYLEYIEEELDTVAFSGLAEDDEEDKYKLFGSYKDDDDDNDEDEYEVEDADTGIFFMPVYCYRRPMNGCLKIDVDFELEDVDRVHMVVVRYRSKNYDEDVSGRWQIVKTCRTRREAKTVESIISDEDYDPVANGMDWKPGSIEDIHVFTLFVED